MKRVFKVAIIPFFFCLFMVSSCEDSANGGEGQVSVVNVKFKALMNGDPFILNNRYMHNGKEMSISALKFFVSDLVLMKGNLGVSLKDIDIVDFSSNTTVEAAEIGVSISDASIPVETYDGIRFGIGVPSDLNAQSPSDFSPNHPLSNEYWSNWNSYIFHKIEGRYDDDNDPTDLEEGFTYHIGFDDYFRERVFGNQEITVIEGNTTEIVIELELSDLLKDADGLPINFSEVGYIHSEENQDVYTNLIANNWMNAFSFL